jgi:hypothetical protein
MKPGMPIVVIALFVFGGTGLPGEVQPVAGFVIGVAPAAPFIYHIVDIPVTICSEI